MPTDSLICFHLKITEVCKYNASFVRVVGARLSKVFKNKSITLQVKARSCLEYFIGRADLHFIFDSQVGSLNY